MFKSYKKNIISKRQLYRRVRTTFQQLSEVKDFSLNASNSDCSFNLNRNVTTSFPFKQVEQPTTLKSSQAIASSASIDLETFDLPFPNNVTETHLSESETESSDDNIANDNLVSKLRYWSTIQHKIPQSAFSDLLRILSPYHPELPLDSRTILNTPKKQNIQELESGQYIYLGILNGLTRKLTSTTRQTFPNNTINLSFNIDGIPIYNSSNIQFWPILCLVTNSVVKFQPFVVAVFCGKSKPIPLDTYLNNFVSELNELLDKGFLYLNTKFNLKINNFICDAPARAYIKCTKSHGGYAACDKCTVFGIYTNGKVIYRDILASKRTDESFLNQVDEDHHKGISPLVQLPLGLVTQIPIDYMHSVCLGVTRKLINSWISGPFQIRLRSQSIKNISDRLVSLKSMVPHEINRKPRELSELGRWKATEFRTFLLYTGPTVIKNIVPLAVYEHFLLLHCGILILISSKHLKKFGIEVANEFLRLFVNHCENLYGFDYYVYNIHSLCHLSDEVSIHGPLDQFSAFPFENYLGQLKRLIRSPNKPLQQLCRRLSEIDNVFEVDTNNKLSFEFLFPHNDGPSLHFFSYKQFKQLISKDYVFSSFMYCNADAYCLSQDSSVIQIQNILADSTNNPVIIGKEFKSITSLYSYPIESMEFNIYVLQSLSNSLKFWDFKCIVAKCFVYPLNDKGCFVSYPLLH